MTIEDLLDEVARAGIRLDVAGEALEVDAPAGCLTSTLQAALVAHKPSLVVALAPSRGLTPLRGGLVVPVEAIELALDMEAVGVPFSTDNDHRLVIDLSDARINDSQRAAIIRWRRHLGALVEYCAQERVS